MESPTWDTIPLLALECIIEHLEEKDVFAATSTCRHWRSLLLMYEGHKNVLQLSMMDLEKCSYLVRLYKKHTRRLHILIDGKTTEELNTFMCFILPQFLDSTNLQEIVFIGPPYLDKNSMVPYAQLRRVITETLVYKHAHVLEKFAVLGCELNVADENDRLVNDQIEYYSKPLSFQLAQPFAQSIRENTVLSRCNVNMMMFSNLKHIVFEYDLISTETLVTLSKLDNFKMLSINFMPKKSQLPRVDWAAVTPLFSKGLEVAVNLIYLTEEMLEQILENALVSEMPVTSIKALFLRNFYMDLVMLVTSQYSATLTEFVWADPPAIYPGVLKRIIPYTYGEVTPRTYAQVNPFIYLSWQCSQLQKLVIHGYWICENDLLGVTRLRPGIDLIVSSIYDSTDCFLKHTPVGGGNLLRVMTIDAAPRDLYVNKVLKYVYYRRRGRTHNSDLSRVKCVYKNIYMSRLNEVQTQQLTPKSWTNLPQSLRVGATPAQRTEYIASEVLHPWGIT